MRVFILSVAAAVCLGCGPGSHTHRDNVNPIGIRDLAKIFRRDAQDKLYTGRLVRCHLEPGAYRIEDDKIKAVWFMDDLDGCVCFECATVPADTTKPIVITGRCLGTVRDGKVRTATVDYYVRVADCSVVTWE